MRHLLTNMDELGGAVSRASALSHAAIEGLPVGAAREFRRRMPRGGLLEDPLGIGGESRQRGCRAPPGSAPRAPTSAAIGAFITAIRAASARFRRAAEIGRKKPSRPPHRASQPGRSNRRGPTRDRSCRNIPSRPARPSRRCRAGCGRSDRNGRSANATGARGKRSAHGARPPARIAAGAPSGRCRARSSTRA